MTREILFRGKRADNGEWVEGYYVFCNKNNCGYIVRFPISTTARWVQVIPETIGQYTGLKDKNGVRIFEGDMVKIHQFLFDGNEYEKEIKGVVKYIDELASYGIELYQADEIKKYMGYLSEDVEKPLFPICNFYGLHEESNQVIGNIHDGEETE